MSQWETPILQQVGTGAYDADNVFINVGADNGAFEYVSL